jgi:GT2 family glycosyltransferase
MQPTRIFVMDNGSSDGSAEKVAGLAGVTVRMLGENLGFAAGNNRAFSECDTEFVALLNPDAFPEPDGLEKLLEAARAHPDVTAFGCRQMVADIDDLIDGIGDEYHLSGLVWRRGYGRPLNASDLVPCEIFSPCAGAALYRRDALTNIGGFDEDFFCYVEDVDLGFRLRLAGHRSMYVPNAVVHHVGSATTGGQHSDFSLYHGHRNLVWTFVKNMPGGLFWALLLLHLLLNLFTLLYFGSRGRAKVIWRAKWDAIKGIPHVWQKRRQIQSTRKVSVAEIWRVLDKRLLPIRSTKSGN